MGHLNYFEPYERKSKHHEDQLTRAYLVVLKYSTSALLMFYNRLLESVNSTTVGEEYVPSIHKIHFEEISIETQVKKIEPFITNKILSVLITDQKIKPKTEIISSERGACYDGVISFSSDLTLIIENKPNAKNVWEEQLKPNLEKIPDIDLIKLPAIIEWKEIIKDLNKIINRDASSGPEKLIILDFLDYVDNNYSFLNPYDNLTLCKDNNELILRRLKNILISISKNPDDIKYHQGWRTYYIETGLDEIRMIGFEIGKEGNDREKWYIDLCFYFGDTMRQARAFYSQKIPYKKIQSYIGKNNKWEYISNFHISRIQKHIDWFDTPKGKEEDYYTYWSKHLKDLKPRNGNELLKYLKKIDGEGIIEIPKETYKEMNKKINKIFSNIFYISPGVGLRCSFSYDEALKLDKQGKYRNILKKTIENILTHLGFRSDFIK